MGRGGDTTGGKLTANQEKFTQEIIKGKSQREAYYIAYPNSKKWKEESVDSKASTLFANVKVQKRYQHLLKKHQDLVRRLEKHAEDGTLEFAQKVDNNVLEFLKNNQMFGSGVRKGGLLYISKIPYQTKKFLTTDDNNLKKYYLCYCPWVRGALKDGSDEEISNIFCHCSAGWYKLYWDQVFEESIEVIPTKSALLGDLECSFTIRIPEKILNNNP